MTHKLGGRRSMICKVLVAVALVGTLSAVGCGGSAGVENGSIHGRVYGNTSGGSSAESPVAGVTVVAQRESGVPEIIRTTRTNANGEFVMSDLPTGRYTLGFDKEGFRTITTEEGNTRDQTAVGNQIRVFVEPGSTSEAPDVVLRALSQRGDCTVVVMLLDSITGQPITQATVLVGAAVTSNGGTNGIYTLSVPVNVDDQAPAGTEPNPVSYRISADGFDPGQGSLIPVANETVNITVVLVPKKARITGYLMISAWDTLYDKTQITISSDTVPQEYLVQGAAIQDSGYFTVFVPASNQYQTRQFNLTFSSPVLQQTIVSNIVAPRAEGTRQLTSPVVMNPITVDVIGTVSDSSGGAPNQLNPSGLPDTVTVKETGQVANIINGAYTIADVPTCAQTVAPNSLTLSVTAYNPTASSGSGLGAVETRDIQIMPRSDGSANPTFAVPLIVTGGAS